MTLTRCSFFFTNTATTEIYTLSLHDALPISGGASPADPGDPARRDAGGADADQVRHRHRRLARQDHDHLDGGAGAVGDRKSTRLNSSHITISYAVFCLKKKTTSC